MFIIYVYIVDNVKQFPAIANIPSDINLNITIARGDIQFR